MGLSVPYLILYNVVQYLGWTAFFVLFVINYASTQDLQQTYDNTFYMVQFFQYLAILEIVHIILRLVRSPLFTTFVQVMSRVVIVFVLAKIKSSLSIGYVLLSLAWSITEMVRYTYYYLSLIKHNYITSFELPYFLVWCRYSFFIVLYPIGVSGELITLWNSTKELKNYALGNITLAHLIYFAFVLYVPGLFMLYTYMLKQRKSTLKKQKVKKNFSY